MIQNYGNTNHIQPEVEHQGLEIECSGHVVKVIFFMLLFDSDDGDLPKNGYKKQTHHRYREIVGGDVLQLVVMHDEEREHQI